MSTVEIRNVRKSFGSTTVLHGIDLAIADGEFCVLVGPSGCGKSTLLRMIAGLEEVIEGDIRIGERIVNTLEPMDRDIAMVFQNYALYPHMTVYDNMGFSLKLAGIDRTSVRARVHEVAEILGLAGHLDRFPRQLSGGQRQRVAMGRAMVRKPQVFLFDEPLSNLDAKLRVAMRTEIKELHIRLKTTSIYVTHDQIEAMTMADKIVVMNSGRIEQIGEPLELYDNPVNRFVAGFIGSPSMNFLDVEVEGSQVVLNGGSHFDAPSHSVLSGASLVAGVRPEHIEVVDAGITAQVVVVEPTGADTLVLCRIGTTYITLMARERHSFSPGQSIQIRFTRVYFFDRTSGHRTF